MNNQKTAIIIGAGPAGLTAAYELITRAGIRPIILESTADIGGISKTINYKGNRIDIGGHRFFSKSDRVMEWWQKMLPIQGSPASDSRELDVGYRKKIRSVVVSPTGPDPEKIDRVMLIRDRLSRIFFLRTFFNYPISLSVATIRGLGLFTTIRVGISYIWSRIFPVKNEKTLEDFFINRFGKELYETFFKDYTEKVWGVSCKELGAQWGAQRIKGLSISKAISHALKSSIRSIFPAEYSLTQKNVETSLIERFLYPKFGPGQMWELVAEKIIESGGELHKNIDVKKILIEDQQVVEVHSCSSEDNSIKKFSGDFYFSTMPIKDLVSGIEPPPPDDISRLASGLVYRDFMTVGVLLSKLKVKNSTSVKTSTGIIPDNWIYIQEKDVKVGRIQVFNNWSPYMVADSSTVWLGLEYFCNEGDDMWSMEDSRFIKFAVAELEKLGFCDTVDVLDATVIRIPKTYPAYTGTYDSFEVLKRYIDTIENLFLIGRNGMHRYNNQDHSMLTAMVAVDNIISGIQSKDNIWAVNTEDDYHEEK